MAHGTDEQKQRYLEPIVTGKESWCQLFSEPNAGSDLAGLQGRAERDGDRWRFTGQKVWTSGGTHGRPAYVAGTDRSRRPKHRGISYLVLEMSQPGVDVRPLREMTGHALFNEVFLDEAEAHDDALIGGRDNGWAVANTTLANERAGLGAGGVGAAAAASPGAKVGHLERRAGDFAAGPAPERVMSGTRGIDQLIALADQQGKTTDPVLRDQLMRLHSYHEIARYTALRSKAAKAAGRGPGPEANTAKLAMSRITRLQRDLSLTVLGAHGTLFGRDAPDGGISVGMALFSPAVSIYGGSDEIQRNIIGERVLGLPGEPRVDKDLPFSEIPKN